jgi:hypothetical protein
MSDDTRIFEIPNNDNLKKIIINGGSAWLS